MATYCLKPVRGRVARITKLDACGTPVHGANAFVVTDGYVSVEMKMNVESPTEYKLKGANDRFIYNSRGKPLLRWIDVTINFGLVDPYVYTLTTGSPLVLNDAGTPEAVGISIKENVNSANFALELWTDLDGQACAAGATQYGYLLLPFVVDAIVGDYTVHNETITFPIAQARTANQSLWGTGPYNVVNKLQAPTGPSPLLTPIAPDEHNRMLLTTLAPPAAVCGAQTLP